MEDLLKEAGNAKSVAIAGHLRPDGDCVGATLAVWHYLRDNLKDVKADVYLESVPKRFEGIEGADSIRTDCGNGEKYELFISLDCADTERLGKAVRFLHEAKKSICIDHHVSNKGFADENLICPEIGSTCEVLFGLMQPDKMSLAAATAIYLGMAHDTGVFRYSNTTAKTVEIASKLMAMGVQPTKMIDETFYEKTYVQNQVLGRALMESMLVLDGNAIVSAIREKDMKFYGVTPEDLEGIVSQLQLTKGTHVALFLYEMQSQVFKVSLRSDEMVDVSEVAMFFNGGGHKRAAGCKISGSYHDVINNLLLHIDKQLKGV